MLVPNLEIASTNMARMRGLLGRHRFGPDEGMLIERCPSIHTVFMRFAIDAVFLERELKVLKIVRNLVPWRLAFGPRGTCAALELAAGRAEDLDIGIGRKLVVRR